LHPAAVRDATKYGPGCPQVGHNPDVPAEQSEDCLNLNIWAPASAMIGHAATGGAPVGLFFHGGAFKEGSNRGPFDLYDGANLASAQSIVVVTANYRLGALGFLTNDRANVTGNFGIQDQRMAMRWVQQHIGRFGGDPRRVTVWGESAGAQSVLVHLFSPLSRGLFSRAIMESNPAGFVYRDVKQASAFGEGLVKDLGCARPAALRRSDSNNDDDDDRDRGHDHDHNDTALACLRAANLSDVLAASRKAAGSAVDIVEAVLAGGKLLDVFLQWVPTSATPDLPVSPLLDLARIVNRVPTIIGTNANEGITFIDASIEKPLSALKYGLLVDAIFGVGTSATRDIKRAYPWNLLNATDARPALGKLLTDYWFRCASARVAASLLGGPGARVYVYNHSASFGAAMWPEYHFPFCVGKVCHGAELPFVFGNSANWTFTPGEKRLADRISGLWGAFVWGETSGNGGWAAWPEYNASTREAMVFQLPASGVSAAPNALCPLWDRVGYTH
jgi:carboxylesterase type B